MTTTPEPANDATAGDRLVDASLSVHQDRRLVRAHARSERFLLVEVTAPTIIRRAGHRRPPVNLGFVLDRSGSMGGHRKLSLARQAVDEAIGRLEAWDRFSLVAYDDRIDVVTGSTIATPGNRHRAAEELRRIEPRGSTNLHGGWLAGCEQVALNIGSEGVNRVLLLTDGLANQGVTAHDELAATAADLRRRGITTSTFGVGTDFDEGLLQAMADAGGGHFYFVGDEAQMRDHITSEVGEALDVVAREVVLEITVPEAVHVEALSPFGFEQRGGRVRVTLGDLVSGQRITVVLRLRFDYGEAGRELGALARISDRDGAFEASMPPADAPRVAWTYADHAANDVQPRDTDVDRAVARLFATRARQEAVRLNREGRFADAAEALAEVRRHIDGYAGSDAELRDLARELDAEAPAFLASMPEMDRKHRHFTASTLARSRSPEGRSIRHG